LIEHDVVVMDEPNPGGDRQLIDFVSSITDSARFRIEENLPHGFVRLKVAEAERRQAQHDIRSVEDIVTELVRNARDAGARNILVGFQKEQGRYRKIAVIDDGCGIPQDMHNLVFEPRVTSKSESFEVDRFGVHGRGMALFSIRSRADSAAIVSSLPDRGTAIAVTADTIKVSERSDQATLPQLQVTGDTVEVGPGPHNVPRVLLEISVDSPGLDIFLGSFSEILATAKYLDSKKSRHAAGAIWLGLSPTSDARALAFMAETRLGLPVSERNAYRILGGEIAPLEPVFDMAGVTGGDSIATSEEPSRIADIAERSEQGQGARSPLRRLGKEDIDEIAEGTSAVVEKVVGRYFLKTSGQAKVRRGRGKITISLYVTGEEGDKL
jgi:Histidine kinase-, DNA gyrase B-, and HSP90-like ATPase